MSPCFDLRLPNADCQLMTGFGSPRPSAGEGLGVRGTSRPQEYHYDLYLESEMGFLGRK